MAELGARVASLEARLADSEDDLDLAPPLVDTLTPEAATDALVRLGRRATLPMYASGAELQAVLAALPDDRDAEVWIRGDLPPAPTRVASLADAVAHVAAHGTAAVVEGSGARVDPDGVVHLVKGTPASSAEARLRWRAALDTARDDLAEAEAEVAPINVNLLHTQIEGVAGELQYVDQTLKRLLHGTSSRGYIK